MMTSDCYKQTLSFFSLDAQITKLILHETIDSG